ncbi:reverse transcriptase domain-containing protein [Tanacetum coccineum]
MAGPEPITPSTSNQNNKNIIEGHISALKELLKEPNNRNLIKPMLLDFEDSHDVSDDEVQDNGKGKAKMDEEDLSKPFKEILKCPFTRRIVEFSSPGHRMPTNVKTYDGTGDPEDHIGRFVGAGNQGEWPMPVWCRMFQQTLDGKARAWKTTMRDKGWINVPITFPPVPARDLSEEPLVVEAEVEGYLVQRIHIDEGASIEIMFEHCFNMLHPAIQARLVETQTTVSEFSGEQVKPLGKIELDVCFGGNGRCRRAIMKFTVIPAPSPYNIILGRPGLRQLRAIPSTIHGIMKFPTPWGVATIVSQATMVLQCGSERKKQAGELPEEVKVLNDTSPTEHVLINPAYPEQLVVIGKNLSPKGLAQLKSLLKRNNDIFAWEPSDMTGVPKRIIKHSLHANPSVTPVRQKRRVFCSKKSRAVTKEVAEWLSAGIVRPVKYPTWISNPVLVKKADGSWRMCIDFKNINSACPKDYYPLSEIDSKIKAVMGFPLKCFLDAYKGYHQVQMADEDEEKTAFYTNQGTYCYTKMPFGLNWEKLGSLCGRHGGKEQDRKRNVGRHSGNIR